jgi:hypothetical protein
MKQNVDAQTSQKRDVLKTKSNEKPELEEALS